jgi:LuxR family maltose regulon positive regulatory protein
METRNNQYDAGDFILGRISMKAMEAVCRYQLRDRDGAFAALKQAYLLAQPNALYMPFMEMGKDMRALAAAALKDGSSGVPPAWLETVRRNASAYAKKLFIIAEQYQPAPGQTGKKPALATAVLAAGLSRREREVLTGLSQGLTREEIAGLSSISVNTVKSVIRSVYNKLGAVNRADAIRIATSLGLL